VIRDLSLRTRLVLLVATQCAFLASVLLVLVPARTDRDVRAWVERKATAQVELLAVAVAPGLEFADAAFLGRMLALLETQSDARCARILDADAVVVSGWGDRGACRRGEGLVVERAIVATGGTQGTLEIGFDLAAFEAQQAASRRWAWLLALGVLILGSLGAFVGAGPIVEPLARLTRSALEVARGQTELDRFGAQVEGRADSRDEVARLGHALRLLTDRLSQQMAELDEERARAVAAESLALASSAAKSTFLANMSHELRTPLNAIIGYAELIEDEVDFAALDLEPVAEDLARICWSGRHLLTLINDVLDLAKVEAGRVELTPEWVDLVPVIERMASTVAPLALEGRNTLHVEVMEPLMPVLVDRVRLDQCMLNLLSNACKFTHEGTISLTVRAAEQSVAIVVEDTGIGMSADTLERIFLPFEQADASTTRTFGGTGLGLALTRRLARLMGGEVAATSQLGIGSTFVLTLPGLPGSSASPPSQSRVEADPPALAGPRTDGDE